MGRTGKGKKQAGEGSSSSTGRKRLTQVEINELAAKLVDQECEKERGIDLREVHDTPIPGKVAEMGWETLVQQPGPINKTWVALFLAAANPSTFREGVMVRRQKVPFNPKVINRYWGTEDLANSRAHNFGFPIAFPEGEDLSEEFVADIRTYPRHMWGHGAEVDHRELNIPDAFWNIFVRHTILPTQKSQHLTALNSKVIKCIHNGLRFDVGEVACQHMHSILFGKLFGRLIYPSLITHLCTRAGVPAEARDVMVQPGMQMIHKDWLYAIRYRPAHAWDAEGIAPPPESRRAKRTRLEAERQEEERQKQHEEGQARRAQEQQVNPMVPLLEGPSHQQSSFQQGPDRTNFQQSDFHQGTGQDHYYYGQEQYSNLIQRMDGFDSSLQSLRSHYDARMDQQSAHIDRLENKIDAGFAQQQSNFLSLQEQLKNWMLFSQQGQSSGATEDEPEIEEKEEEEEDNEEEGSEEEEEDSEDEGNEEDDDESVEETSSAASDSE